MVTATSVSLNVHSVPQEVTTPLLDVATDGKSLVWSTGANAGSGVAPDVYQMATSDEKPRKVFSSSDRHAVVGPLAVSGDHVALVETNPESQPGMWRLWYVRKAGVKAVLLDESDDRRGVQGPYPFVAMDGDRVVWTAFHQRDAGPRSEIWLVSLPDLRRQLLEHAPLTKVEHWFPALDGDDLVFGTVETSATTITRHVYLRNLAFSNTVADQLDTSGKASMPAISGDNVVWKESPDNVLERGTLHLYSISSHQEQPIAFGDEPMVNTPSIGTRFIAADVIDPTKFFLYDLASQRSVKLRDFPAAGREVYVRPHIRGNLVVWAHSPEAEGTELVLEWSQLPR